ncbi:hypothetical protein QYF61_015351 [Mycteria americana]|uniref:Uncharacterized protein n=1 Tax=Mycteria americana TaxID=33587 RepID=A0AAN7MWN5_MYCAM|nr:hypothetical protein QYF61_015351 [Mycteria americana]
MRGSRGAVPTLGRRASAEGRCGGAETRLNNPNSQPFLIREVLQPSDHFCGPPLDPLQQVCIFLVLGTPELDAVLQYGPLRDTTHYCFPLGHRAIDCKSLDVAIQPILYPSNSPSIKPISLQFNSKNVVGDHIKDLTEVQEDVFHDLTGHKEFSSVEKRGWHEAPPGSPELCLHTRPPLSTNSLRHRVLT